MTFQPRGAPGGDYRTPRPSQPATPDLPQGYLAEGYFDSKGNVLPQVIQDWPMQLAKKFKDGGLASTQLRRFFNKARAIEQELKSGREFDRVKEEVLTLKPLAAAAVGRKNAPEIFNRFMEINIQKAIEKPEAFTRGFIVHFQSIVAYTKYFEEQGKAR